MDYKLGKLPYRHSDKTLMLANYVSAPSCPAAFDVTSGQQPSWPMYVNDKLGDCTAAAAGHMIGAWTVAIGGETLLGDKDIVSFYSLCSGYNPRTGQNDNGAVELDVLNIWTSTGLAGHKLSGHARIDTKDVSLNKFGLFTFGGLYLGVALPAYLQAVVGNGGDVWDLSSNQYSPDAQPGSWGGHAVNAIAYCDSGVFIVSWGKVYYVTWRFYTTYFDEAWAPVSKDYLNAAGVDPQGLNLVQLESDLKVV